LTVAAPRIGRRALESAHAAESAPLPPVVPVVAEPVIHPAERPLRLNEPDDGGPPGSLAALLRSHGFELKTLVRQRGRFVDSIRIRATGTDTKFVLLRNGRELGRAPSLRALGALLALVDGQDRPRGQKGATLLEASLALAILAALAAVAAPVIGTAIEDIRTRAELRSLWSLLAECRGLAVSRAEAVPVDGDAFSVRCGASSWSPTGAGWRLPTFTVEFSPLGSATPPLPPLALETPSGPATLTIRASGAVSVTGP
jgi:hypothetical protein